MSNVSCSNNQHSCGGPKVFDCFSLEFEMKVLELHYPSALLLSARYGSAIDFTKRYLPLPGSVSGLIFLNYYIFLISESKVYILRLNVETSTFVHAKLVSGG